MKIQKLSTRISFYMTIISLVLLIIFSYCSITLSIFSGIFASSLLSLTISISTYLIMRKQKTEALVITSYQMGSDSDFYLYQFSHDLSIEKAKSLINILNSKLYEIYIESHELYIGMFWFHKIKKEIRDVEFSARSQINKISDIEFYMEENEADATENINKIFKDLEKLVNNTSIYHMLLKISRKCNGELYSQDEFEPSEKLKKEAAEKYRNSIK